ncbi:BON domain-containing protein [Burkholderia pseudomallei]|uniref:BON domain-containing protein n=1 Tax=Burkholderia pseudomallei TaxID=28450 RepID=UPI00138E259E|nr:BON domain-containing protein [Burkholderia pseudomallei]
MIAAEENTYAFWQSSSPVRRVGRPTIGKIERRKKMLAKRTVLMLLIGLSTAYAANASELLGQAATDKSARSGSTPGVSSPSNSQVAMEVRRALGNASGMDVSRISVIADAGTVTLLGSTTNHQQIDRAQQLAESVGAVKNVINHLTVRNAGRGS